MMEIIFAVIGAIGGIICVLFFNKKRFRIDPSKLSNSASRSLYGAFLKDRRKR